MFTYPTLPISYVYVQWGEQVFDTLPILQVFLLTEHVERGLSFIIGTLQL